MKSLKESNCCLTRLFSSKKALMTAQESSCHKPAPTIKPAPRSANITLELCSWQKMSCSRSASAGLGTRVIRATVLCLC